MQLPRYLQVEPVGQCNLRCRMCPIQFRQDGPPYGPPAFMDFGLFTRLLDQLPELEELHLQGLGEPMMHPRFFDMVEAGVQRGVRVTTNSNLTLLTDKRAVRCVESGLAVLHGSIDGVTPETYEWVRVRSHFDRVVGNLQRLRATRDALAATTPRLHLVMVLMRRNLDELPTLVRAAADWGADELFAQHLCHDFTEDALPAQYRPMREFVEAQTLLQADDAWVSDVFDEAREAAAATGIRLRLPHVRPKPYAADTPGRERCDWPWRGGYVSYQGYAMPCCMISTPDRMHMGSVTEMPFERVWNGEAYQSFRSALDSGTPPDICAACSLYRGTF